MLDIFNDINDRRGHVTQNSLYEYSRALEPRIAETHHAKRTSAREGPFAPQLKSDALPLVLKRCLRFLDSKPEIVGLLRLSKSLYDKISPT